MAVSGQGWLQSFTLGGRAGFTLLAPFSQPGHAGCKTREGCTVVRHVAAQKPLARVALEACEVPRLLQARGRDLPRMEKPQKTWTWLISLGCASSELSHGGTTGGCQSLQASSSSVLLAVDSCWHQAVM